MTRNISDSAAAARDAARNHGRFGEQRRSDPGTGTLPAHQRQHLAEQCRQMEEAFNTAAREAHRRYVRASGQASRFGIVNILAMNDVPADATVMLDPTLCEPGTAALAQVLDADGDHLDIDLGHPEVQVAIGGDSLLEGFAGPEQPTGLRELPAGHAYEWAETELANLGGAA